MPPPKQRARPAGRWEAHEPRGRHAGANPGAAGRSRHSWRARGPTTPPPTALGPSCGGGDVAEHVATCGKTPALFPPAEVEALGRASRAVYGRIRPLLVERGRRGLIRRIHGDLHLGNIAMIEGAPVLFDAIEFSALIGSGDVLYDLAFLLMDLLERGLPQGANAVFNRYLAQTRRPGALDSPCGLPVFV